MWSDLPFPKFPSRIELVLTALALFGAGFAVALLLL